MSVVFELIKKFFENEKMEFFAPLKFSECTVINQRKLGTFCPESAVMFLIPYKTGEYKDRNISLYSVSKDYHLYAKELDEKLGVFMAENFGEEGLFRIFCDSSPIAERSAAIKAGLGVKGKNGLLINEKYGSYVFVGTLLTDVKFSHEEYKRSIKKAPECIGCGKCVESCLYLSGKSEVCLSELTQKKKVSEQELELIKTQKVRWGCDGCQEICPMNQKAQNTPIDFFYEEAVPYVTKALINSMSEEDFRKRAYSWRGRDVIVRNIDD